MTAPVKPPPGVPEMPAGMPRGAVDEWGRVVPILDSMGVLSILDRAALADYCICVARCWDLEQLIGDEGFTKKASNRADGPAKSPLFTILRMYRGSLQRWCELFGLAPGPRGRLDVPEKPEAEDAEGILD